MLEIILVIISEVIFPIIGSFLGELIFLLLVQPFREDVSPNVRAFGYALIGLIIGVTSLWISPTYLIKNQTWRLANLFITPLIAGLVTAMLKVDKLEKKPFILKNHRFYYGFLLALGWLLVRLIFAKQVV